ncbi:hypothetical protein VIGAN_02216400, partial [Vigna angularis var. angularis]
MVRIKMDPDNLSTRKNVVIYSEIGLDVSPSSSLDDSPSKSEGISCDPHEAPFESPTIILQYKCIKTIEELVSNTMKLPL